MADQVQFDWLRAAWRAKWLIMSGMLIGAFGGTAYQFWKGSQYESTAQILVIQKHLETSPLTGPKSTPADSDDYLSTHQVVITSERIAKEAVNKHKLNALVSFQNEKDAVRAVRESLSTNRSFSLSGGVVPRDILNLKCVAQTPGDARQVLDAVIAGYKNFLKETYRDINKETEELVRQATQFREQDLGVHEKKLQQFLQKNPLIKGKDGMPLDQGRLLQIDAKRSDLQLRRVKIEALLQSIESAKKKGAGARDLLAYLAQADESGKASFPAAVAAADEQSKRRTSLEEELTNLRLSEAKWLEKWGADHVEVKSLQKRVRLVKDLLSTLTGLEVPAGKLEEYRAVIEEKIRHVELEKEYLVRSETAFAELYDQEKQSAEKAAVAQTQLDQLRKNADRSRELYQNIVKRLQELNSVKDFGSYRTQILSPPEDGKWLWRNALLLIGIGGFVGAAVGVSLGFAWDLRGRTRSMQNT